MDSLSDLSSKYGRAAGDEVLKNFAMILKSFGDLYGFVGYNGGGVFYAFFPDCSPVKLDVILKAIGRQVEKYNQMNPNFEIHALCGKAVSGADGVFEVRDLLRLAMTRMNSEHTSLVTERAIGDITAENTQDRAAAKRTEENSDK